MSDQTYIVAEIGNTHEGSVGLAKQIIKEAAKCGANAVKMQTHIFSEESLDNAPNPPYFTGESRKDYFNRTAFKIDEWLDLKNYTEKEMKIDFFSSPFSNKAVDMLEKIGVKTYKIASGEVTNIPLLEKIAKTKKNVILSSGMSSWQELDEAVELFKTNRNKLTILQCVSQYPCPPDQSGLNIMAELKNRYGDVDVGYSDHTIGLAIPIAAVVLGAKVIEKHFTLSRFMYGSDAFNSIEPNDFKFLVQEIRNVEKAIKTKLKKDEKIINLKEMKTTFEKSIYTSRKILKNKKLTMSMLSFKKPGDGLPTKYYKNIIGKKINKNLDKNHQITFEDLE